MEKRKPTDQEAEKFGDLLLSVFDIPLEDIKSEKAAGLRPEAKEAALKFFFMFYTDLKDFLGDEDGERAAKTLEKLTFADIIGMYGKISQEVEAGKTPADIVAIIDAIEQGEQERPSDPLPLLRSIIPQTAVINNSKLAGQITEEFLNNGSIPLLVSSRKSKKEIEIVAAMTFDNPNVKIASRQPYTAYDRAVYNAICSLWEAGNTAFTPAMVYLAMNGQSGTQERGRKVSPQACAAVTRSIEKQRFTRLTIDCTEQMGRYKDLKRAKFDANMLTVEGVEMTAQNGAKVKAYTFTNPAKPPVLYDYSRSIGQVISVPPRYLNSGSTINNTDEVIVLREFLIRRIEGMKAKNSLHSKRIEYAAIYDELGIEFDELTGNAKRTLQSALERIPRSYCSICRPRALFKASRSTKKAAQSQA